MEIPEKWKSRLNNSTYIKKSFLGTAREVS